MTLSQGRSVLVRRLIGAVTVFDIFVIGAGVGVGVGVDVAFACMVGVAVNGRRCVTCHFRHATDSLDGRDTAEFFSH
jgi:hypothetical protein